jgi:mannose-6-phosphate isomerase-like protein (cupin superfamily)
MPTEPSKWISPNRPHWKLAELLAKHKGEPNWTESVVNDATLRADYISMAPGAKTPRRLHPDTRAWWIVQDGQVRFTIDGQEPFVARRDSWSGAVPQHLQHGDGRRHAVASAGGEHRRRHHDVSGRRKPTSLPGFNFVKVRIGGKGSCDTRNKPYVDFNAVAAGTDPAPLHRRRSRRRQHHSRQATTAQAERQGHFHLESSEFWFILEGQIRYRIGSLPVFLADQGDIVFVPKQTWHLASHGPTPMSTRLAMNGYQDLLHNWEPTEEQTRARRGRPL